MKYTTLDALYDELDELDDIIEDLDEDLYNTRLKVAALRGERAKIWAEAYAKGKAKKPDEPDERNPYA